MSTVASVWTAAWHMSMLQVIVWGIATSFAATLLTTIKLHRGQTHQVVVFNEVLDWLLRMLLWLFVGVNRSEWAQVHRKHHIFTDQPGLDPHSPLEFGRLKVLLFTAIYYQRALKSADIVAGDYRLKCDDPVDWWDKWLFNNGFIGLGVSMSSVALLAWNRFGFGGTMFVAPFVWVVVHYGLYLFKGGLVNAGHKLSVEKAKAMGTYLKAGVAADSFKTAWLTMGEWGDHLQHHLKPYSVFIGRWYGDPGGMFIWLMINRGFAWQPNERELTRAEQRAAQSPGLAMA